MPDDADADAARLSRLYEGHVPIATAIEQLRLTRYQRVERVILMNLIGVLRPLYWLVRRLRGRPFDVTAGLEEFAQVANPTRGTRTKESHGGDHLTAEQVATYERDGVLGPLPLLTPEEAAAHRAFVVQSHAADWHGEYAIGKAAADELKRNGLWAINHGAIWQERNVPEIRAIAQHPVLAQRLASLIGDDVVAWRTQMFVVEPDTKGTFWHAATTFTEDGDLPALTPPPGMPAAMANVSCWIALEDVDVDTACLRIIPGSHSDVRLDTLIRRFSRDRLGFVMHFDRADRWNALTALRYTGDIFLAGQVAFDVALRLLPDLYESIEPAHYPMRAGECLLFSSNNLHGSYPNRTSEPRLAMGIRYTSSDVGIYAGQPTIPYATGVGTTEVDTTRLRDGVPVHSAEGPVAARDQ